MGDSGQEWSSMHPSDDPSEVESALWRHVRDAVMPGRLDSRVLFALWRSVHSCVRAQEDCAYPRDENLVGAWLGILLGSVSCKRRQLSRTEFDALIRVAYDTLGAEVRGRVAGRHDVARADEWVLVQALQALPDVTPEGTERQ